RPLAGRTARLQAGPLVLQFAVAADGSALASDADPHVTIDIGARALAAGLSDPAALLKDAQVWGDAEFAQVLSRVAERLRPDPEEDLSRLVGDAAAVRIMGALRTARDEGGDTGARAARQVGASLAAVGRRLRRPRAERLRLALESLGPLFVKFGQLLSTRRDLLPEDIADELARLQDRVPPFDSALAVREIERGLGRRIAEVFSSFDHTPVASASIAQVHLGVLAHGPHAGR